MAETFVYPVRAEPSGQEAFRTITAPFGDGYSQSVGDGINAVESNWNCTARGQWDIPDGVACAPLGQPVRDIAKFLRDHAGHKSFIWTAPDGTEALWRCQALSMNKEGKNMLLTWTMVRSYFP